MIDFPTAPAVGTQVIAPDGTTWEWDGALWQLTTTGSGTGGTLLPAGTIVDYIGAAAPIGWLTMAGQTITNGQTLYPALWAVLPTGMKSGANIVFPDTRGRVVVNQNPADPLFDVIGDIGGTKDAVVVAHNHSINPPATNVGIYNEGGNISAATFPTPSGSAPSPVASGGGYAWTVTTGVVDIAPFNSGDSGSAGANMNIPPFVTFMKIIRAI